MERRCIVFRYLPTEEGKLYYSILYIYVTTLGDPSELLKPIEIVLVSAEQEEELAKAIEPNELVLMSIIGN